MKGHNTVLLKSSKKDLSAVRLTFTSYCYFTWLRDCYIQTQCCLISKHDPRLPGSKDSGAAPQERRNGVLLDACLTGSEHIRLMLGSIGSHQQSN